jgi:glycerol kinase
MADCLVAIDQGTTSTRAMAFSREGETLATAQTPFEQIYPQPGWVEHDPEVIWATTLTTTREVLGKLKAAGHRAIALGVTNQRETTVVWDRTTGAPVYNAIVWQDRRTAPACRALEARGAEGEVAEKTGLRLDPTSRPPRWGGSWTTSPAPGRRRRPGGWRSARSTAS